MKVYKVNIPAYVEIKIDMSLVENPEDIKKVGAFIDGYISRSKSKAWPGFDIDVKPEINDDCIMVIFDGAGEYNLYPGSKSSWEDPGASADIEFPFELNDFLTYVKKVVKAIPFDVPLDVNNNTTITSDNYINNQIWVEDCNIVEDEDTVYTAYELQYPDYGPDEDAVYDAWKDRQFESILNGVLSGKTLTEAINVNK